mgnify:FL=1
MTIRRPSRVRYVYLYLFYITEYYFCLRTGNRTDDVFCLTFTDKTTMVLVGREMPDEDPPKDHVDGCDTRFVRGAYVPANLERGLDDPRERLPDMVILFNADAWGCQWRR